LYHVFAFPDDGTQIVRTATFDDGWQDNDYLANDPNQSNHASVNITLNSLNNSGYFAGLPQIVIPSPYVAFYNSLLNGNQYLCCSNNYQQGSVEASVCQTQFNLPALCSSVMNSFCSTPSTAFVSGGSDPSIVKSFNPACVSYCNGKNCNTQLSTACQALQTTMIATNPSVDFFSVVLDCGCFMPNAAANFGASLDVQFQKVGIPPPQFTNACNFPPCLNSFQRTLFTQSTPCANEVTCLTLLTVDNSGTINGNLTTQQATACGAAQQTTPVPTQVPATGPSNPPATTNIPAPPSTPAPAKTSSAQDAVILFIIAIIILILIVVAVFLFRKK
jgi:hypothetical protein